MSGFPATWVLVADGARARIFSWTGVKGPLEELEDYANPEARLKDSELDSDRAGVTFASRGHQSGRRMQAPTVSETALDEFARQLATALKQGLDSDACERLVLVAPPSFLGRLRSSLDHRTGAAVAASLDNDLSLESAETILARLPRLSSLPSG